jgi:formylmethanofuran dehydrogenase subunit E-like metal-binding protein
MEYCTVGPDRAHPGRAITEFQKPIEVTTQGTQIVSMATEDSKLLKIDIDISKIVHARMWNRSLQAPSNIMGATIFCARKWLDTYALRQICRLAQVIAPKVGGRQYELLMAHTRRTVCRGHRDIVLLSKYNSTRMNLDIFETTPRKEYQNQITLGLLQYINNTQEPENLFPSPQETDTIKFMSPKEIGKHPEADRKPEKKPVLRLDCHQLPASRPRLTSTLASIHPLEMITEAQE